MSKAPIFTVILAGGQSSRLFPFNKILSDLTGSGRSLIQQAFDRLGPHAHRHTYVITVREMIAPMRRQLKLAPSHFLTDPVRRGTWPAILWAMAHFRREDPTAVMAIVTGDHVIQGDRAFQQAFRQAVDMAQSKPAIVMMGIPPRDDSQEWRGFGCFRADDEGRVIEFQEKPNIERAQQMLQAGGWLWNSGMFFFRIPTAEAALRRLQPDMYRVYAAMAAAMAAGRKAEAALLYKDFPEKIPHPLDPGQSVDNSIDFAIMTPLITQSGPELGAFAVQDVRFTWTDLGQWTALRHVVKADRHGNIKIGNVSVGPHVQNCILAADRNCQMTVQHGKDTIFAIADGKSLILPIKDVGRIKEIARQNALIIRSSL